MHPLMLYGVNLCTPLTVDQPCASADDHTALQRPPLNTPQRHFGGILPQMVGLGVGLSGSGVWPRLAQLDTSI